MSNVCLLLQDGLTALHKAAFNGHPDTYEVLLKNNANVNAETKVTMSKKSEKSGTSLMFVY